MTSLQLRKSISRSPLWPAFLPIPLVLACFALVQLPAADAQGGILDWGDTPLALAIITFDAPGAGTGPGQGTTPYAINPAGTIMGSYLDASNVYYGFLRATDSTITTFAAPGAGTAPYQGTQPLSINPARTITGVYQDASGAYHGFLRTRDGAITTFDVPGAGTGPNQGTVPEDINRPSTAPAGIGGLPTALLPRSTFQAGAQVPSKAPA